MNGNPQSLLDTSTPFDQLKSQLLDSIVLTFYTTKNNTEVK